MNVNNFIFWWQNLPSEIKIFLYSMIPIGELRTALPIAIKVYHLSFWSAWFWSVLGNIFMGALVIWLFEPLLDFVFKKNKVLNKLWQQYIKRLEDKNRSRFEKWGAIALITFVAIPLPMTGAFSGAVVASIFQISPKKAIPLLGIGCAIAGVLVLILTSFLF